MICPFCQYLETKVSDSRSISDGRQVKRRRECLKCEQRFTTIESAELSLPKIVKRDDSVQIFNEDKLKASMHLALHKLPVSYQEIDSAICRIEEALFKMGEREVSSEIIGDMVSDELKQLNHVAYVRFASVYKQFDQIDDFSREVDSLKGTSRKGNKKTKKR